MKYLYILTGFDPTSVSGTPTNAELLQMLQDAQPADDIGAIILSETEPNVTQYPVLGRFRWAKIDGSGGLIGEFYYHDGTSWTLEKPAPGTVTAASLADGTITLNKLSPDGDPYQIIQINAAGNGFQFVDLIDAINDGTITLPKLANAAGSAYLMISTTGGQWTSTPTAAFSVIQFSYASGLTAFSSLSDRFLFRRSSDNAVYSISLANFLGSGILTTATNALTAADDFTLTYDTSAGVVKKVMLQDLLPSTGVIAGTYSFPSSVTVNAKGQVTAILTAGGSSFLRALTKQAVPSAGGICTFAHGLAAVPSIVRVVLYCTAINNGYAVGDEIPVDNIGWSAVNSGLPAFGICADSTNVTVIRNNNTTPTNIFFYPKGGSSEYVNFDSVSASWQVKVYVKA